MSRGPNRNFDNYVLTVGNAVQVAFPVPPVTAKVKKPGVIFVQTPTTNTGNIVVGKTGVLADASAGGFLIEPGKNAYLPVNFFPELFAISTVAGQTLLVTYMDNQFFNE